MGRDIIIISTPFREQEIVRNLTMEDERNRIPNGCAEAEVTLILIRDECTGSTECSRKDRRFARVRYIDNPLLSLILPAPIIQVDNHVLS